MRRSETGIFKMQVVIHDSLHVLWCQNGMLGEEDVLSVRLFPCFFLPCHHSSDSCKQRYLLYILDMV